MEKKKKTVTLLFKNIFLSDNLGFRYFFDLLAWYEHRMSMTWGLVVTQST